MPFGLFLINSTLKCQLSPGSNIGPEAKFLDEIQTKVWWVYLLAIHSHLYSLPWAYYFSKLTQPPTYFYSSASVHCKGEGGTLVGASRSNSGEENWEIIRTTIVQSQCRFTSIQLNTGTSAENPDPHVFVPRSGSGSTCQRVRIRIRIRILPFSHKSV